MQLKINSDRYIWEIQKDFNQAFPYLKLEFFSRAHNSRQSANGKKIISPQHRLGEAARIDRDNTLEFSEGMSVSDLENELKNKYGLSAQVFRRSGNIWLETTMTDSWSLKQQNDHGHEITVGLLKIKPTMGPIDYDAL